MAAGGASTCLGLLAELAELPTSRNMSAGALNGFRQTLLGLLSTEGSTAELDISDSELCSTLSLAGWSPTDRPTAPDALACALVATGLVSEYPFLTPASYGTPAEHVSAAAFGAQARQ